MTLAFFKFQNLSLLIQLDLVCGDRNQAELLQTLVMAGQLVGAAFASSLCDRIGRKTVHLSCNILTLIFGITVAFASDYTTIAVMKFVLGVMQQVFHPYYYNSIILVRLSNI